MRRGWIRLFRRSYVAWMVIRMQILNAANKIYWKIESSRMEKSLQSAILPQKIVNAIRHMNLVSLCTLYVSSSRFFLKYFSNKLYGWMTFSQATTRQMAMPSTATPVTVCITFKIIAGPISTGQFWEMITFEWSRILEYSLIPNHLNLFDKYDEIIKNECKPFRFRGARASRRWFRCLKVGILFAFIH